MAPEPLNKMAAAGVFLFGEGVMPIVLTMHCTTCANSASVGNEKMSRLKYSIESGLKYLTEF